MRDGFEQCSHPTFIKSGASVWQLWDSVLRRWWDLEGTKLLPNVRIATPQSDDKGVGLFSLARLAFLAMQPIRLGVYGGRHKMTGLLSYMTGYTFDETDQLGVYRRQQPDDLCKRFVTLTTKNCWIYKILGMKAESGLHATVFTDNWFDRGINMCRQDSILFEQRDVLKERASLNGVLSGVFASLPQTTFISYEDFEANTMFVFDALEGVKTVTYNKQTETEAHELVDADATANDKQREKELYESMVAAFAAFDRKTTPSTSTPTKQPTTHQEKRAFHAVQELVHPNDNNKAEWGQLWSSTKKYYAEAASFQHAIFCARRAFVNHPSVNSLLGLKGKNVVVRPYLNGTKAYATGTVNALSNGFGGVLVDVTQKKHGAKTNGNDLRYFAKVGELLFLLMGAAAVHPRARPVADAVLFTPLYHPTFRPSTTYLQTMGIVDTPNKQGDKDKDDSGTDGGMSEKDSKMTKAAALEYLRSMVSVPPFLMQRHALLILWTACTVPQNTKRK